MDRANLRIIEGKSVYLILLFVLVPMVELVILFQVHDLLATNWGSGASLLITIGTIIVTGLLGAVLARQQGLGVLRDLRQQLGERQLPGRSLADGGLILFGAALLLTPGFLTDLIGFSLLIPISRAGYRQLLLRWFRRKIQSGELKVMRWTQDLTDDGGERVVESTSRPVEEPKAPGEEEGR